MGRYIDADKFSKNIAFMILLADDDFFTEEVVKAMDMVKCTLSDTKTEDVAPIIHAHWTRKRTLSHDGELYCSKCKWTPEVLGGTTLGDLQLADVYYCPHCGAKMDEEAPE